MPTTASRSATRPAGRAATTALTKNYASWTDWVDSGDWRQATSTSSLALPANASDIMVLALDPDVSVGQLVHVTSRDQVLAARMLRLANSAYCAPLEEITTISDAVVRLGTASVRNVVLAACMASRLQQGGVYGPQGRGLSEHGIGAAFLSQAVAKHAGANSEEAFLYGLVHDLGKLLVLQLSKDYAAAGGGWVRPEELAVVMEKRHAEFGGRLLNEWRLPHVIQDPVVYHHQPEMCHDHPAEAVIVYVANRLSHRYGFGCRPDPEIDLLADPVVASLEINAAWMKEMDARAPALMQNGAAAFA